MDYTDVWKCFRYHVIVEQRTDLIIIDGNLTAHLYLHMVDIHAIETCFTPSAVVNCDIIILWVLLRILMFIYIQIIILSKYNICINFCFVLFLIL